jgi:hypothetical protein
VYRASSAWATHVTIVALFCGSSLLHSSNCVWSAESKAGWSVSTNRNEESTGENCHSYISIVNAITLYSFTIKFQYILLGDYWVCAACPTPRLNRSYELRPPWEQHLRYIPHRVRNGYKSTSTPTYALMLCCLNEHKHKVTFTFPFTSVSYWLSTQGIQFRP